MKKQKKTEKKQGISYGLFGNRRKEIRNKNNMTSI